MAKLTVLMPVYNSERFLVEAIDSILQQSFTDFEFLILDDGSTDNSASIVRSYADPRIRFIQNATNTGISSTLNKGIDLAKTDLIARMDADDISHPHRLEKQYAYLQAHPDCAMVSSLVNVIGEDGRHIRQDKFKSEHFYYNLTFICWIYHPTVMYRKKAVEEVNKYTARYSEDFELFWQLSRKYLFYNLHEVLLDYRITDQSLHQVTKKEEYEEAQHEQVMRNLRYYAGSSYTVPRSFVECYRHNFEPLLEERSLQKVIACIRELDFITQCIIHKENINHNTASIKTAAAYKRRYITTYFAKHLPLLQKVALWLSVETPKGLKDMMKARIAALSAK